MRLQNNVAIVTGGSRGIGYAVVETFLFLASDEASYITGVVPSVDGLART